MSDDFGGLGFAGALAQSRSVQALVRTMNLFAETHEGACSFKFERHGPEGVEINFGTSNKGASERGLNDVIAVLSMTEELMLLQAMIANLQDRKADHVLINALVDEAHVLIKKLYPSMSIAEGEYAKS
jgi:hypothetical protein